MKKNSAHKVAIAGYGAVGKEIHKLFPEAKIYDPNLEYKDKQVLDAIFLFICVPTPAKEDDSCDTSIVEEIIKISQAKINIIRSTVSVGFTEKMINTYKKPIVFMPEYGPSDFKNHPFNDLSKVHWAILGGDVDLSKQVAELWLSALYKCRIYYTNTTTAELVKLAENAYFFNKVIFFNQFFEIAQKLHINYDEFRMLLTEDPRIEEDHSFIYPSRRQIGGKCLPKDMNNLINLMDKLDLDDSFFKKLRQININLE